MKGWILGALLVTFFAGISCGFLVGQKSVPPPEHKTWIDLRIEDLKAKGVTGPEDLAEARRIYEAYRDGVLNLRSKVNDVLRDPLERLAQDTTQKIQKIQARYASPQEPK